MKTQLEVPNISIAGLLEEIKPVIRGATVEKAQDLPEKWFKLRLKTKNGGQDLVFSPKGFFLAEYRIDALQQSSGFGAFLKKRLQGKRIENLEQLGAERIVKIKIGDLTLAVELFGKGNLLLLDEEDKILMPYRRESWSSRTLARGIPYEIPPERGTSPQELKIKELQEALSEHETDVLRALLKTVNAPPALVEEACARAGIQKQKPVRELKKKEIENLIKWIKALYAEKGMTTLITRGSKKILLPFKPKSGIEIEKEFGSLNSAMNELLLVPFVKPDKKENKKLKEMERTLAEQEQALENSVMEEKDSRKKAEFIYSNYTPLTQVLQEIKKQTSKKHEKEIMYTCSVTGISVKDVNLQKKRTILEVSD